MVFVIFCDIADVAAAQAQTLGRYHRVLGGNQGVRLRKEQVAHVRLSDVLHIPAEHIVPAAVVGAENQHHGRLGDEGLVVAAFGQRRLFLRVGDVQNGVQGHVARRRGLNRRFQHGPLDFRLHRAVFVGPDGLPVMKLAKHFVHSASSRGFFFSSGGKRKGLHTTSQRLMGVPRL